MIEIEDFTLLQRIPLPLVQTLSLRVVGESLLQSFHCRPPFRRRGLAHAVLVTEKANFLECFFRRYSRID
jgi:hypothetical protein